MFSVAKDKIKPIISITIGEEVVLKSTLDQCKEPFIFLKKQGQLFAYVTVNNPLLELLESKILFHRGFVRSGQIYQKYLFP
ncbi:hypothetical protein QFZ28_001468 [Neobacillus niacini]|nr:hypothetical protein [Neobacillus niacini]